MKKGIIIGAIVLLLVIIGASSLYTVKEMNMPAPSGSPRS